MNWVGSSVSTKTGFEVFMMKHFGLDLDLSSNVWMAVIGLCILLLPFFFAGWSNIRNR